MEMDRERFRDVRNRSLEELGDHRKDFLRILPKNTEQIKGHYEEPLYRG